MSGPSSPSAGRAVKANHEPLDEYAADWPTRITSLAISTAPPAAGDGVTPTDGVATGGVGVGVATGGVGVGGTVGVGVVLGVGVGVGVAVGVAVGVGSAEEGGDADGWDDGFVSGTTDTDACLLWSAWFTTI